MHKFYNKTEQKWMFIEILDCALIQRFSISCAIVLRIKAVEVMFYSNYNLD